MKIQIAGCSVKASKRTLQNPIFYALKMIQRSCEELNHTVFYNEDDEALDVDVAFMFGSVTKRKTGTDRALIKKNLINKKIPTFHLDTGLFSVYIRNHLNVSETGMFRLGMNDCVGTGDFFNKDMPDERYKSFKDNFNFIEKDPITNKDGNILFLLQSEKGWQYNEIQPFWEYARNTIEHIRKITKRNITIRAHPSPDRRGPEAIAEGFENIEIEYAERSRRSVLDSINKSFAVVTHSSSAAVESIVEGIPTFALDERCIAYDACESNLELLEDIEKYNWNNRMKNLYGWAYTSWHVNEFENPVTIQYYLEKGKSLGYI
tara:strand:+ start:8119 stop:9075 length:957 start_codon:yes stop_codon:yes gene_type:complete